MNRGRDKEYKPEDYLKAFSEFVKKNPDHLEAIEILLSRPKDWSTDALLELQDKLVAAPQRFTREHLQKAHQLRYDVALADLISMVKHAADENSPLMTAEQRVEKALAEAVNGKDFTEEQKEWLQRIRTHLVENLSIDDDDFKAVPIFARHGGLGRVKKVFGGQLRPFLAELNEKVAA